MKQKPIRSSPAPIASTPGDGPSMVTKFQRENPVGKLVDPPEIAEGRDKPFAGDLPVGGETPEAALQEALGEQASVESPGEPSTAEGAAAERPGEAAAPPTPTEPQGEVKPTEPAQPSQPAQPTAEVKPAAPATPEIAKINREAKYELLPGHEWTGEQILAGLQQRAELAPKAEEADKFRTLLGGDYADAEGRWKPVLEKLQANPARTQFLEEVLATEDPAALDYLRRSLEFYKQEVPGAAQPTQPAAAQPVATDNPEIQALRGNMQAMEDQLMSRRFNDEQREIHGQYTFLNHDEQAKKALYEAAANLFATDAAAGKPTLQRRGLVEAAAGLKVFLEAKQAVFDAQRRPSAPSEPDPRVGAQRLLPGSGPGAAGTARPAPPREYRGDPDKARDQFLQDYPD